MKKKKFFLAAALFLMTASLSSAPVFAASKSAAESKTQKNIKRGWVTKKGYSYYYDRNGKMVKNRIVKIKGYYYSFDKKGRLQKNRSVSKNGYTYYANKQGRLITGWRTSKGYSYYYDRNRRMVKDRIVKIGGYYYSFDENGRMQKNRFIRKNGHIYFANKKGRFVTGWITINKKRFYFNKKGEAIPGIQTVNGKTYYFSKRGERLSGWRNIDGKKYYFHSKTGVMLKNRTVDGVVIDGNGTAPLTKEEQLDQLCADIVASITNDSMTGTQKLAACFRYMSSHSNFSYMTWRNFSYYKDWHVDYAYEMLTRRAGNCDNFACGFAYLAKACGYNPVLVRGRIHGTRDGAADGFTRHCWVTVNGLVYDPEGAYAGFAYVCGSGSYPLAHQIQGYDQL